MSDTDGLTGLDHLDTILKTIKEGLAYGKPSPVLRWPGEAGLECEDVYFPSADGTPLEAWFIPRAGSDRLVICARPINFSRAGFPSNIEP